MGHAELKFDNTSKTGHSFIPEFTKAGSPSSQITFRVATVATTTPLELVQVMVDTDTRKYVCGGGQC